MSDVYVKAIKQPDSQFLTMKKIYDGCFEAGIEIPDKVLRYFSYSPPDERGLQIDLGCLYSEPDHDCCTKWEDGDSCGLEIDLDKLPDGVKIIRVVESC